MGNPHFVTFVEDVATAPVEKVGRVIEHSSYFPERVNVEFVEIVDDNHVKFRVWERGSGETLACGTGACAVAYTAIHLGQSRTPVTNSLPLKLSAGPAAQLPQRWPY